MLFAHPANIVYGVDSIDTIPAHVPGKRILLITGKSSARKNGLVQKLIDLLAGDPREIRVFSGVSPEPCVGEVQDARDCLKGFKAHAVIAAGGGSVIDVGKAAAGLAGEEGTAAEYFQGRRMSRPGIFFGAVPTTAGTGSEATPNSVLSDPEAGVKQSIRAPHMVPDLALLDPRLTLSCSGQVTAHSGLDALVQAIEALFSRYADEFTDGLACTALMRMYPALPRAFREPENIHARTEMLYGAFYTGMAFANCRLGAVHGLAHPVGVFTHTPHGLVCARLIRPVLKRNREACPEKYQALQSFWGRDPLEALTELLQQLDIAPRFDSRLNEADMLQVLKSSASAGSMRANPVDFCADEQRAILREAGLENA